MKSSPCSGSYYPRPLTSHAPHEGHDECLAVADKIKAGRWTDAERFGVRASQVGEKATVWCTGLPETCSRCGREWMATAVLLLPSYDEVAAWRSYCATNPH